MRKFTLTGAHSTGKTTLLKKLQELYPDIYFTHSVTRETITKEERKLDEISDGTQEKILKGIESREKELVEIGKDKNIFMDRCFLDFAAYTEAFYKKGLVSKEFLMGIGQDCDRRFGDKDPYAYDVIFYLPIEFDIVDDGERNTDEKLQSEVDLIIQDLLIVAKEEYGIRVVHITGTLEERVKRVQDVLRTFGI